MNSKLKLAGTATFAALLLATSGLAAAATVEGMIIGRDGSNMIVRTDTGKETIALTDTTDVKAISGALGLGRDTKLVTDLIPGLPVKVDTEESGGMLTATAVRFKAGQLTTALQVEAGLHPTATTVAAHGTKLDVHDAQIEEGRINHENLKSRFEQLGDYDVKAKTDVLFATNSAVISADGKKALQGIATQAKGIKGYLIHVAGHADTRGSADLNQRLSLRRAAAVTDYLQQSCGVHLTRVLAPDAMGASAPTDNLDTSRRVTVEVLVNRGLAAA
jgi:outer membrane protein OmpA-like peptidoglycan-associated protein